MIAASRAPSSVDLSHDAISRSTSAGLTARGIPVSRQLATGGTASPSANGVNPRTNKNRNNDRSSPTFPFAESTDSRSHSRSRNALTCSPPRSFTPSSSTTLTRSPRNRVASATYRATVNGASPRSSTSHCRYASISIPSGVTGSSRSGPTAPSSRR